ncbi:MULTISPECIES: hypothetical protein [unclassified Streptococcus]|uniref:hypothetical protein n=1 Tax=unclassified Streptococcus TaxID=2608887 RepID=UPI0010717F6B|nr:MULTISPECIES: hypothetical protein [unclassified Streptococcus]MBF0786555.1 hypothetical protein [Streptococcus sp. 19428wC2_LYSM12]MCQ9210953.1 hypothetical protein [Streptococcus sp. B01]MCQ9214222.1 hypothetical protein [Streptococcus sp. O1]TFV06519.1 hypothetical protein E4T79_01245 [Streptococcus sp. LYSM12]
MIERPKGKINEIIYSHTVYFDFKYRIYPTLIGLFDILEEIIQAEETTKYISIIPFYANAKSNSQEEFDMGGMYIKCQPRVTPEDREEFIKDCMFWLDKDSEYKLLEKYVTLEDMQNSHFLVEKSDVLGFQQSIQTYMTFLMERGIPQMMKWLYEICALDCEDLPYGYFRFKISSD